ncbi:MAG: 1-acyl-sn-glycerol-3-phosphate acyltransferase [Treponema sp.]|nr:1-acyl-sn-glycerol-3-phosphate acyltransferase [Treponema sp.]
MAKTIIAFSVTALVLVIVVPLGFILFIISFLGLKRPMGFLIYKIAQGWARIVVVVTGCSMTVIGRENIPKKGGVCFVSNHVGIFDIILALAYIGRPFGFIAKKELMQIPGINIWIYFLGGFFIDRRNPRKALKTINSGIKQIKDGGAMLIFPEGTRSRGRGLAPFHPGSFKLATQSEAMIIPMAITGSYDVFEKNYRVCSVPANISFLPLVDTAKLPPEDRKNFLAEKLHNDIAQALEQHYSE